MLAPYGPEVGTEDVLVEMAGVPTGKPVTPSGFTIFRGGKAAGDWLSGEFVVAAYDGGCIVGCDVDCGGVAG